MRIRWKFLMKASALLLTASMALVISAVQAGTSADESLKKFVVSLNAADGQLISDAQLKASEADASTLPEGMFGVALQEEFRSDDKWFLSMNASSMEAVEKYLDAKSVKPTSIFESLFVNSPELGGGPVAGDQPKEGHSIYIIERAIPGIGLAPMEKQVEVSKGSQAVIESLNGAVEWDHSFLTSEGTFCVYRAGDPAMIEEHARIAGVPANPITEVEHLIRNYSFQ